MERAFRAADVRAAEEPLVAAGEPLMAHAAHAIAMSCVKFLRANGDRIPGSTVLAIAGAGNNGGDALYAAAELAKRGLAIRAIHLSQVHEAALAAARTAGVRTYELTADADLDVLREHARWAGVWIDGLLGIGATGGAREPLASWINVLNTERATSAAEPYVIAVDIPSGLGVDDGTVPGPVLRAQVTVAMGCAKPAHLLPPARYYCGDVRVIPLGLERNLREPATVQLGDADVADFWDIPSVDDHKYTRGVVGLLTGSETYPGAGALSVGGALAAGPGMVRYLGGNPTVLHHYPEAVVTPGKVQAWVIGSGLTDLEQAAHTFQRALEEETPVVLDAGAIELVHSHDVPSTVVLTPHEGELTALLHARGEAMATDDVHANPGKAARIAATLTGATVVVKGATDIIAAPDGPLYAQGGAPAWRATAGAGDVFAGLLGGMLAGFGHELQAVGAGHGLPARIAAAAAHVHTRAAGQASGVYCSPGGPRAVVGHPITASDIVRALPLVINEILNGASVR